VTRSGTTQLRATVWDAAAAEPAAPAMTWSATNAALQEPGSVGLTVHRPSGTSAAAAVFSGYQVRALD
jgi:hypothetical protein